MSVFDRPWARIPLGAVVALSLVLAACSAAPSAPQTTGAQSAPAPAATATPVQAAGAPAAAKPTLSAAGASQASAKDSLVIGFPTDISTLDVHKATGLHIIGFDDQIADVLIRLDDKGTPIPWLVESWEWQDGGKSLVLKIRDNVKMHDGNVLSAEDVRYSIERFRKYSVGQAALSMVKSNEAMAGNKVKLSMDAPFAPLLPSLAYNTIGIYSKAAIEKAGDDNFGRAPAGPGPFKFVEQKKGEYVKLEAFDGYWAGKPKIKNLTVRAIPEMGARVAALESGDVDLIFNVAPQDAQRLGQNSQLTVLTPPSARLDRLYFNVSRKPFDNKLLRQAIAHAIDREAITKAVFLGMANVSHSQGPEGAFGYTGEYDVYKYDPAKAKQLLAQAGYPNGFSFKFHFSPGRYLLDQNVVEAIKAQLGQVGIQAEVITMEWGTYSEFIAKPVQENQAEAMFIGWRSINGDVDSAIQDMGSKFFPPNGNNNAFYKSEAFDNLFKQEQSEGDNQKRGELLKEMQKVTMDDLPLLPLYNEPQIWAAKKTLQGVAINALTCLQPLHTAYFTGQ